MFEATGKLKNTNIKGSLCLMLFCLMISANLAAQTISENNNVPQISVSKLKWQKRIRFKPVLDISSDTYPSPIPPGGFPTYYLYQALFTNTSDKKIRGIICDYVFIDRVSGEEVGRHRISNYAKLNKNQSVVLYGKSSNPPSQIISIETLGIDKSSQYIERIEFRCVQYADSSMWHAAKIDERACNGLRWTVRRKLRTDP